MPLVLYPNPNPKTNPNLDPNHNCNWGAIFLGGGGQLSRCWDYMYVTMKSFQQNLHKCVFSCLTIFWFSIKHIGKGFVTIPCCLHMFPFEYNQWIKCYPSGTRNCQHHNIFSACPWASHKWFLLNLLVTM